MDKNDVNGIFESTRSEVMIKSKSREMLDNLEIEDMLLNVYNKKIKTFGQKYHELNNFVMNNTEILYNTLPELRKSISESIENEFIVYHDEIIKDIEEDGPTTDIVVTKNRTLSAAKQYIGKKIGILNFGNNHTPGGNPYSAGTQQETICRCSTLYPCLLECDEQYYKLHIKNYEQGKLGLLGNDDLIYTPNVIVFKNDESAPEYLPREEHFKIDVITAAAPKITKNIPYDLLESVLYSRISKIIKIAKNQGIEVLILGAFGCGGLGNPPLLVASIFKILLQKYKFKKVEFAIYDRNERNENYNIFKDIIQ